MNFEKNESIFFRKMPKSEKTKPNAFYFARKGEIPGKTVCEIVKGGEKWTVDEAECFPVRAALQMLAGKLNAEIESARTKNPKTEAICEALGISKTTFQKRVALIKNHLTK